jgi:biopolymer transport protein ExbD
MIKRHRKSLPPLTQINLTSLLDVAFVLLIAFMIVAPSLKYGLDLDLPTIKEGAPQLAQNQQQLFTIVIPRPRDGAQEFFMNDTPSRLRDIEDRLKMQKRSGGKVAVEIQADREVPYDTFIQVVAAIRRAGVEAVGLPVEAGNITSGAKSAPGAATAPPETRPEQVTRVPPR